MDIILLLSLVFIVFLIVKRRELGFLKNRYYIALGLASVAWWVFLVIDQLNTKLSCTPDDELCNSGNTFWGDLIWGTLLAVFSLMLIWIPAVLVGFYLQSKPTKTHLKKR
jgi:hypothetical protein